MTWLVFLVFLFFFSFFAFFLIFSSLLRVVALFFSFFLFFIFIVLLLNMNYMIASFEYQVCLFKLNFVNFVYVLSFDGISLLFILLCILLLILCLLLVWNLKYKLRELIFILFLVTFFLVNVFSVADLFFFYIFFEALLIPMFLLIGVWGSRERKINAAYQFFLYTLLGSVFMLISILFLYSHYGTTDSRFLYGYTASFSRQLVFWLSFFFSIAVKIPMFPVHIWLPEAHVEAPTAGSVLLAGILLKLGLFALIRFLFPIFPWASFIYAPIILLLGVIGVLYASCSTLSQVDMKKMVAYSSVAHMNFAVLGLFVFNFQGFLGSLCLMLSHGFVSSGLFLSVGFLYERYKTRLFIYFGGLVRLMPIFSTLFFLFILANTGFPGTFSFVGEFLILLGLAQENIQVCLIAGLTLILSVAYSLALYTHIVYGNLKKGIIKRYSDLTKREFFLMFSLSFLTLFLGIFPNFILFSFEIFVPFYLDFVSALISSF